MDIQIVMFLSENKNEDFSFTSSPPNTPSKLLLTFSQSNSFDITLHRFIDNFWLDPAGDAAVYI